MAKIKTLRIVLYIACVLIGLPQFVGAHGAQEGAIGPEQLKDRIGQIHILDVRSVSEYEQAHIETALVLPLQEISEARLTQLGFPFDETIVVYANSDNLAKKAKTLLEVLGVGSVKYLNGGLTHWTEDRFPVVAGEMQVEGVKAAEKQETVSSLGINPATYDFGVITKEGGVITTSFSVTNSGKAAVTIEEISTSCGCTSAEISEKVVNTGETVTLQVFFDPNFHKEPQGRFSRTVFLQTSEGIELEAKIYVEIHK